MDSVKAAAGKLAAYQQAGDEESIARWQSELRASYREIRLDRGYTREEVQTQLDVMALVLPTITVPISCIRIRYGAERSTFELWRKIGSYYEARYVQRVNEVKQGRTAEWPALIVEDWGDGKYHLKDGYNRFWALKNEGPPDSKVNVVVAPER
ncbi:MAG: hypothetical protein OXG98_18940 [Gemmatimonadetes bacterium]|nr:hypothetical protein [Gemmatimonadota bacterium]